MQHASYLSTYQLSSHRSNVLIFITWLVFRGLISLMNGQHNCFIYFQICYALAAGIQKVGRKFRTMKDGELQESWCSKKMSSHNDKEAREDNENLVRMRLGEQGKIWLAVGEAGQVRGELQEPRRDNQHAPDMLSFTSLYNLYDKCGITLTFVI